MAAASLQRMVSRHTRLTCGHGTRLLARSEAMVRSTRADHLHGYLTVAAAHHRGPDGLGRWVRRRSPGLVLVRATVSAGRSLGWPRCLRSRPGPVWRAARSRAPG